MVFSDAATATLEWIVLALFDNTTTRPRKQVDPSPPRYGCLFGDSNHLE